MADKEADNSDTQRRRLSEKIEVPSSPLMVLVPVLGLVSVAALGVVVVLGIKMMNTLVQHADSESRQVQRLRHELSELGSKVESLRAQEKSLRADIEALDRVVSELYFSRPPTARQMEQKRLSGYKPARLLEAGVARLKQEGGRPVPFFEALLENYPDSPEAPAAMLHLGIMRVEDADYEDAARLLKKYLSSPAAAGEHADPSSQDTAVAHYYLAIALSSLDVPAEAARHYETALENFPEGDLCRATARSNLGEIYLKLGRSAQAALHFEKLLKEFDGDKRVPNMLKRARKRLKSLKNRQTNRRDAEEAQSNAEEK